MTEDTKVPENTPESEPANEPASEPQIAESETEPEVIETEPKTATEAAGEAPAEPAEEVPETETAQVVGNEPLTEIPPEGADATAEAPKEQPPTPTEEPTPEPDRKPTRERDTDDKLEKEPERSKGFLALLLQKANATKLLRKEKKLLKVMTLFEDKPEITNDDVEKLLHVSDSTATRYLDELEKRGRITQRGTTGRGVIYTKH